MARIRAARLSDADAIAAVYVETWRDTYAGIIPDRVLLELSERSQAASWRHILRDQQWGGLTLVAERPDAKIIGFANAGRARQTGLPYDGEIYTLYVLPNHQGAGHGRGLVGGLFSGLLRARLKSALVWVLAENPARFFYQALGGKLIATRDEPFHGVTLSEQAYGWSDLRPKL
jgi:ribosomal protein S18 acetylase RimI-like enzyme